MNTDCLQVQVQGRFRVWGAPSFSLPSLVSEWMRNFFWGVSNPFSPPSPNYASQSPPNNTHRQMATRILGTRLKNNFSLDVAQVPAGWDHGVMRTGVPFLPIRFSTSSPTRLVPGAAETEKGKGTCTGLAQVLIVAEPIQSLSPAKSEPKHRARNDP